MSNEMITQLPSVSAAQLTDITMAVQGYISPSSPGLSVQETWQQVLSLFLSNSILNHSGNPNGHVAGTQYQTFCWDSTDNVLYICTTTGSASTAGWTTVVPLASGTGWTVVVTTSVTMTSNNGYIPNNSSLVTLTLPTSSNVGDILQIAGIGSGGWIIAQNTNQSIQIGSVSSSVGTGGSVASTNRYDSIELVCTVASTNWQAIGAPQSLGLTIV